MIHHCETLYCFDLPHVSSRDDAAAVSTSVYESILRHLSREIPCTYIEKEEIFNNFFISLLCRYVLMSKKTHSRIRER